MSDAPESCPWCVEPTLLFICSFGSVDSYRCKICKKTITIKYNGDELVTPGFN